MAGNSNEIAVFNWGKGVVPSLWATILIGVVLVSNCVAILVSLPYTIENVPREYVSSLDGGFTLPYVPLENEDIELLLPASVPAGDPFDVRMFFSGDRAPSIPFEVVFFNGTGTLSSSLLPSIGNGSRPMLYTRHAGLLEVGTYDVYFGPKVPGYMFGSHPPDGPVENISLRWLGPWELEIVENLFPHPLPILSEHLSVCTPLSSSLPEDGLTFDGTGIDEAKIGDYRLETGRGGITDLVVLSEGRWSLKEPGVIEKGWNTFHITYRDGNVTSSVWSYLCWRGGPIEGGILNDTISIIKVLSGTDQLYDQVDEGPEKLIHDGEIELYQGAYYELILDAAGLVQASGSLKIEYDDILVHCPMSVFVDGRTYWLSLGGGGSYGTMFRAPTSMNGNPTLEVVLHGGGSCGFSFRSNITLLEDRSPGFRMVPDPYDLGSYSTGAPEDLDMILSADWADFNRKDFSEPPRVVFQGSNISPMDESEDFFGHDIVYRLGPGDLLSGGEVSVHSENTFHFANWVSLILPIPGLFLTFPFPIVGWGAVIWFVLISMACLLSVGVLLHRTLKPLWSRTYPGPGRSGVEWFLYGKNDLAVTAKAFLGAMFFFYGVYWMFEIFEQPTPGLGILSQETPIWIRMFLLADASVWEEISNRSVLIGIPMLIYHSLKEGRGIQWRQLVGGTGNFGYGEFFFILLSAALFGLAHLSWGPWKVVPTFVHGLIFGYLFVKVGLHASISMHFLFDYSDILLEVVWNDIPTLTLFLMAVSLMVFATSIFFGGLFLGEWVGHCHVWLSKRITRRKPGPAVMLIVHSGLSALFGIIYLTGRGLDIFSFFLLAMPLLDAAAFYIWCRNRTGAARWMVFFGSYLTWGLAPFGLTWVVEPEIGLDHGE
ncbi:MAG: CPBP family intramembrane metalloprotease [Candidatus Thermoplasmatota archaeon]|nr:CPBP family intramembrane metalloprotease [Candidatus Thermoplasmatota archaeon]